MLRDVVGLENEKYGTPLLKKIISKGVLVQKIPDLDLIHKYFDKQFESLPKKLLDIENKQKYPVIISQKIKTLYAKIKKEHNE